MSWIAFRGITGLGQAVSFSRLRIKPCQLLCFFFSFHKLVASLIQFSVRAATLIASDSNLGQLDEKLERYLCAMLLSLKLQPFSSSSWKVLDLRNLLQDIRKATSREPHEDRSPGTGCCPLNFLAVLLSKGAASVYLEHSAQLTFRGTNQFFSRILVTFVFNIWQNVGLSGWAGGPCPWGLSVPL